MFNLLIHEQALNSQCDPVHHSLNLVDFVLTEGMADPGAAEHSQYIILGIDHR
ncbi:hypothetical protein D3C73_1548010 [compost metagenome]